VTSNLSVDLSSSLWLLWSQTRSTHTAGAGLWAEGQFDY